MAHDSSLPDNHEDTVLELVTRLFALEYERGKLMAQLEFHLRVRNVAAKHKNVQAEPRRPISPLPARKSGQLEQEIIADLAKCGALTARQIAHNVQANSESVRQTMQRLVKRAQVVREGKTYHLTSSEPSLPAKPSPPPLRDVPSPYVR